MIWNHIRLVVHHREKYIPFCPTATHPDRYFRMGFLKYDNYFWNNTVNWCEVNPIPFWLSCTASPEFVHSLQLSVDVKSSFQHPCSGQLRGKRLHLALRVSKATPARAFHLLAATPTGFAYNNTISQSKAPAQTPASGNSQPTCLSSSV